MLRSLGMCLSLGWLQAILIWAVVIGAIILILKVIVPPVLAQLGMAGGMVARIVMIVLWAVILILLIYFAFDMITCLSGHLPALPRTGR